MYVLRELTKVERLGNLWSHVINSTSNMLVIPISHGIFMLEQFWSEKQKQGIGRVVGCHLEVGFQMQ